MLFLEKWKRQLIVSWKVGVDSRGGQTRAILDSKDPGTAFLPEAALCCPWIGRGNWCISARALASQCNLLLQIGNFKRGNSDDFPNSNDFSLPWIAEFTCHFLLCSPKLKMEKVLQSHPWWITHGLWQGQCKTPERIVQLWVSLFFSGRYL